MSQQPTNDRSQEDLHACPLRTDHHRWGCPTKAPLKQGDSSTNNKDIGALGHLQGKKTSESADIMYYQSPLKIRVLVIWNEARR